ncbi:MaoC family dehydratase N-terminal domain-containing protein [Lysinibacillus sp. NPDC097195]|uniref:FAS1-like dehydratase domain-containing protein n=1 Tax=Lysinibacillus sp. NPDC097195 TaxID=3364141 RepID=UPI003827E137
MIATKKIIVTTEWIQNYAKSIEAPLQYVQNKLIAPVTMPIIFWQQFEGFMLNNQTPLFHGSQQFTYHSPIFEGMVLDCELELSHTVHKQGKAGMMTLFTYTLNCLQQGIEIVQLETVLIQVGAVT